MGDDRRSDEWIEVNRSNMSAPSPSRETVRPRPRDTAPPPAPAAPSGSERAAGDPRPAAASATNRPQVLSILYLASLVIGLCGIIAFILALVWRAEPADAWEDSHYDYHIRTFLIWLALFVIGIFLFMTIVGALLGLLVMVIAWVQVLVRAIMSLVRAQAREPMPNPHTLLA